MGALSCGLEPDLPSVEPMGAVKTLYGVMGLLSLFSSTDAMTAWAAVKPAGELQCGIMANRHFASAGSLKFAPPTFTDVTPERTVGPTVFIIFMVFSFSYFP